MPSFPLQVLIRLCAAVALLACLAMPATAKTLRMAYDADPTSLDPHEQLASATLQLSHLVFDPLVRFRQDMSLEPRLAKSWEQIDANTTRFHLRDGVHFHSGRTLTADDVVWTFNRLKRSPDFKGLFEPFSEARAVDPLTVDLITKTPYPLVLNLATYIFPMDREFYSGNDERGKPKDDVVKHGASFASGNVSGTGPFVVTEREQGVKLNFKRFADYWDKASPGNVDADRLHADQGTGDTRFGIACRRCGFHRAGAADRFHPREVRFVLPADHHAIDPHPHLRAQ